MFIICYYFLLAKTTTPTEALLLVKKMTSGQGLVSISGKLILK